MSGDDFISDFYKKPSSSPSKKDPSLEKKEPPAPKKEIKKKKEIIPDKTNQSAKIYREPAADPQKELENIDIDEYFKKITAYHDEIQTALHKIYETMGQSYDSIQTYLDNPQNFTEQEYAAIQKKREDLRKNLLSKLTKETQDSIKSRSQKDILKKRKGKMIGSRKRWLTMD